MSYDIIVVDREFSEECMRENYNIGEILEKSPNKLPNFSDEIFEKVVDWLLNKDELGGYAIESKSELEIRMIHKKAKTLEVSIRKNIVYFTSGFSESEITDFSTCFLSIEPGIAKHIRRFDFQSNSWC